MHDNTNHFGSLIRNFAPVRGDGKRYMPGLDGLWALSVMAVMAYHLNIKWAQGMLFTAAWLLIIHLSRVKALSGAFLSSMFYVNNWWLIFHQVSYFESFGPPSPEEMIDNDLQFYD